jgi:hypothetical protein
MAEKDRKRARPRGRPAGVEPNWETVFLAALLAGADQATAARTAGVSVRAARRRMQAPGFAKRLAAERQEIVRRTTDSLSAAVLEAVEAARTRLLTSDDQNVVLAAFRAVMDASLKMKEITTFESRLREIEAALAGEEPPARFERVG